MATNHIHKLLGKPKNTKLNARKFQKALYDAYLDSNSTSQYKKKNSFAPSTIGFGFGTCSRYWWYAFNGTEFTETTKPMNIASMKSGTAAHERIEKLIESTGLLKENEREILYKDPPIRGFADAVLEIDGEEIIGEIKTIKDQYFMQRKASKSPSDSHLLQLLIYMHVEGTDEGFILYENKDSNELMVIPVVMNTKHKDYIEYVFDWMREVYAASQGDVPPARGYTKSTFACKACPVSELCWSDEEGDTKIANLKVGLSEGM